MILIITQFSLKNRYQQLFNEYVERLTNWKIEYLKFASSEKIQSKLSTGFSIALDLNGLSVDSMGFADLLYTKNLEHKNIIFLVGSDSGLDDTLKNKVNIKLSFGKHTWPHQLCIVMLAEQIYRAQQIINNHPYHK